MAADLPNFDVKKYFLMMLRCCWELIVGVCHQVFTVFDCFPLKRFECQLLYERAGLAFH